MGSRPEGFCIVLGASPCPMIAWFFFLLVHTEVIQFRVKHRACASFVWDSLKRVSDSGKCSLSHTNPRPPVHSPVLWVMNGRSTSASPPGGFSEYHQRLSSYPVWSSCVTGYINGIVYIILHHIHFTNIHTVVTDVINYRFGEKAILSKCTFKMEDFLSRDFS